MPQQASLWVQHIEKYLFPLSSLPASLVPFLSFSISLRHYFNTRLCLSREVMCRTEQWAETQMDGIAESELRLQWVEAPHSDDRGTDSLSSPCLQIPLCRSWPYPSDVLWVPSFLYPLKVGHSHFTANRKIFIGYLQCAQPQIRAKDKILQTQTTPLLFRI
jgi:hypothetical protein